MNLFQSLCAGIALVSLANPVLAAPCASPSEAAALKTSVMLQQMMVAAFQCRESAAYNRFISTYRGELQSSDAALKAFFVRRGGERGEAGYDTFKTKAANLSGLEQARDARGFCADTRALFIAAAQHRGSLASFVEARSAGMDIGAICKDSRPVMARADKPLPAPIKPITVAGRSEPMVRMAEAEAGSKSDIAIGGVPDHAIPANPYRRENIAPPPRSAAPEPEEEEFLDDEEYPGPVIVRDEPENLPPRARAYQVRERDYADDYYQRRPYGDSNYGPPAYGPPRGWQWRDAPRPRYGYYYDY